MSPVAINDYYERARKSRLKRLVTPPAPPLNFFRADPVALAAWDPRTKVCTMNCGPHRDDPRSREECRFLCDDCAVVAPQSPKTLEEVYGSMKDALKFFGVSWGDMSAVTVKIRGSRLVLEHNGSEIALELGQ